jgi:hypothetical protein
MQIVYLVYVRELAFSVQLAHSYVLAFKNK